jgi:hypothetical protein
MSFDAALTIGLCGWLSRFQIRTLWSSVLKTKPRQNISSGEALLFWTMNHLESLNVVTRDQLQLAFEHFGKHIVEHGNGLYDKWLKIYMDIELDPAHALNVEYAIQLSTLKLGFMDSNYAVVDGLGFFLDLNSGEAVEAVRGLKPLETRIFDLTTLWIRYFRVYRSELVSAETGDTTNDDAR